MPKSGSFSRFLSAVFLACLAGLAGTWGCQESHEPVSPVFERLDDSIPVRVYFTQPGLPATDSRHPARALAHYISQARQTLDLCAHELDSAIITQAILEAHQRGVCVRVVTETAYSDEDSIRRLKEAGIPVVHDQRDGALMHNKFIVLDNQAVWTGSMNFTDNCTGRNDNHALYIADARLAENYATKFRWMFEQRRFGSPPGKLDRIPYPQITWDDGTLLENYFAPHDRVADKILLRVRQATRSIRFLAFSFTHRGIADAMLERARQGVEVSGVFERRQAHAAHSMYQLFASFGPPVQVYLDGNKYNMHHKLMILDGRVTIGGSFNWSMSADKDNDENVIILHSEALAKQFEREFCRVFEQARSQTSLKDP
ncbi:MAG: phospholipase D-like domain-containing protein [Gemmatales bacterium]|nr:phospholipase D-like domain-containing protein [Gemmatales bacterium]MCS7160370.1 phospholipase D-like domain-containing protein [Gemmatales bacterium]MDW8175570.1 phospholipase D-like domain-containing protein [Gemmatales bacterium]MDW8221470.1 phospholipase D-like domain-containing protein [Gemmatales bacterium]